MQANALPHHEETSESSDISGRAPNQWRQLQLGHLNNTLPGMEGLWIRQYAHHLAVQSQQAVALIALHIDGLSLTVYGNDEKRAATQLYHRLDQNESPLNRFKQAMSQLEASLAGLLEKNPEMPVLLDLTSDITNESDRAKASTILICGKIDMLEADIETCLNAKQATLNKQQEVHRSITVVGIGSISQDLRWQFQSQRYPAMQFEIGPTQIAPCEYDNLLSIRFDASMHGIVAAEGIKQINLMVEELTLSKQSNHDSHLEKMRVTRFIKALDDDSERDVKETEKISDRELAFDDSPVLARLGQAPEPPDAFQEDIEMESDLDQILDLLPIECVTHQSLPQASCPDWPEVSVILDTLGQLHLIRLIKAASAEQHIDQEILIGLAELAEARNWISDNLQSISETSATHKIAACQAPVLHLVTDQVKAAERMGKRIRSAANIYILKSQRKGSSQMTMCEAV